MGGIQDATSNINQFIHHVNYFHFSNSNVHGTPMLFGNKNKNINEFCALKLIKRC